MNLNILCLDDEDIFHDTIKLYFKDNPRYHIDTTSKWESASLLLESSPPIDILILDLNLGSGQPRGMDLIPLIKKKYPDIDIIVVTGQRDPEVYKEALSLGATDCYPKPFGPDLLFSVQKLEQKRNKEQQCLALQQEIAVPYTRGFIGRSAAFLKVLDDASAFKGKDTTVLIEGETGTGKELLAKYLYDLEENPKRPFIVINCGALPKNLAESELFGHEKGAFTGAFSRQIGKFQLADGGDIFLDEINSLEPEVQAKLLRVVECKDFYPLGSRQTIKVKVRIIAAANADLAKLVEKKAFRDDLYHRLKIMKLSLPPLRKRREDIPLLIDHFVRKYDPRDKRKKFTDTALHHLTSYDWPGNLRELDHMMQSLIFKTKTETIDAIHLPEEVFKDRIPPSIQEVLNSIEGQIPFGEDLEEAKLKKVMRVAMRGWVEKRIRAHGGNRTKAAKQMGITRQSIYHILHRKDVEET